MDAHDLFAGHRKKAEGVVVPQVGFGGDRQILNVGEGLDPVGIDALGVKLVVIELHIVVAVSGDPLQPLQLEGLEVLTRHGLMFPIKYHWFAHSVSFPPGRAL